MMSNPCTDIMFACFELAEAFASNALYFLSSGDAST